MTPIRSADRLDSVANQVWRAATSSNRWTRLAAGGFRQRSFAAASLPSPTSSRLSLADR